MWGSRKAALQVISSSFCEETTLHALPRAGDTKRRIWARVFWTITLLFFAAVFIWQAKELLQQYFTFGVHTETIAVKANKQPFPAVTICNMNPYQVDKLPQNSELAIFNDEINNISQTKIENRRLCEALEDDTEATCMDAQELSFLSDMPTWFQTLNRLAAKDYNKYSVALQRPVDFVRLCQYNNQPCNFTSFKSITPHPWYGRCYSFNSQGNRQAVIAGMQNGLDLLLTVNYDQYSLATPGLGVIVHIHDSTFTSFPEIHGFLATTGATTSVAISRVDMKRLSVPYGECYTGQQARNAGAYFYKEGYTLNGCRMSCAQSIIIKKCKCYHFAYAKPSTANVSLCQNDNQTQCVVRVERAVGEGTIMCPCYPPCDEKEYKTTISQSKLYMAPQLESQLCNNCSNNILRLKVFFESLNYYRYVEVPDYTWADLVSNFGGQFGLWLGASFISVLEIMSFCISVIGNASGCISGDIEKKQRVGQEKTKKNIVRANEKKQEARNVPMNKSALYPRSGYI